MTVKHRTVGSRKDGIVEGGSELTVVIASPVQAGVIARHREAVQMNGCTVKFDGRLTRAFGFDMKVRDVNTSTGSCRHGVPVVNL